MAGSRLNYPMRRAKVQNRQLPQGSTHHNIDLSNQKHRPNRMLMGMVHADGYSGDYRQNPFRFQNWGLSTVEVIVDGLSDNIVYNTDFTTKENLARPYADLARMVGRHESGQPFSITYDKWQEDMCVFGFDLTEQQARTDNFRLQRSGNMSVNVTFATPLPNNVTVILVMEYDDNVDMGLDNVINTVESVI